MPKLSHLINPKKNKASLNTKGKNNSKAKNNPNVKNPFAAAVQKVKFKKRSLKTSPPTESITSLIKQLGGKLKDIPAHFKRPGFNAAKKKAARLEASLASNQDFTKTNLKQEDLAAPHRAPYALLRNTILNGEPKKVKNITNTLMEASLHCENAFSKLAINNPKLKKYADLAALYQETREEVEVSLKNYTEAKTLRQKNISKLKLVVAINNLASNAPGLGPDSTTNGIVSDRMHLHPTDLPEEPLTPRSSAARKAFPDEAVATTKTAASLHAVVSVTGAVASLKQKISNPENINVGSTIFRGALFVHKNGAVDKPKNPNTLPTGDFKKDWEQVQ